MAYNYIGKHLEETFGGTEFWLYTPKQINATLKDINQNMGTRIIKTSAGIWLNVS